MNDINHIQKRISELNDILISLNEYEYKPFQVNSWYQFNNPHGMISYFFIVTKIEEGKIHFSSLCKTLESFNKDENGNDTSYFDINSKIYEDCRMVSKKRIEDNVLYQMRHETKYS